MWTLAEVGVGAIFSDSGLLCSSVTHWGRGLDAKHQLWSSVWRESCGGEEPRKLQHKTVKNRYILFSCNNDYKKDEVFLNAVK